MRKPVLNDSLVRSASGQDRAPASLDIIHDGIVHRVAVKRIGTARRFTLRVRIASQDAVLTMPARASMRTARSFVERHAEWIGTRLQSLPERRHLDPDAVVPFRGVDHRIVHDPAYRSLRRVGVDDAAPDSEGLPVLRVAGQRDDVGRHLLAFLRREAHRDLRASVDRHMAALGKTCRRIALRDTTSRWGSCSSKGNLNFSWRLIMAPPFVLDYLAAHECAHLCHMNHSAEFWAITETLAPQTEAAEAWLRTQGTALHLYGI